jgi:GWxTD domain-containing protein
VADVLAFYDASGDTAQIWIAVQLPLRSVFFEPGHDAAEVQFTWKVTSGDRQVAGDVVVRRVVADAPDREDADLLQLIPVTLPHGSHEVQIEVGQPGWSRVSHVSRRVVVDDIRDQPLLVSSLYLSAAAADGRGPAGGRLRGFPLVTRSVGAVAETLVLLGEIYAPLGCGERFKVSYRVVDESERTLEREEREISCEGFRTPFELPIDTGKLVFGDHRVELSFSTGRTEQRREFWFTVDETRLPMREGFARTVDIVRPIAKPEEIAALEDAPPSERETAWDAFWRARDPDPETPGNPFKDEFFRRLRYTNQHFGTPFVPGWKSDRGTVYLQYGPPDRIDREAMSVDQPARETWHYHAMARRFVFVDREGLGDYRLVSELEG